MSSISILLFNSHESSFIINRKNKQNFPISDVAFFGHFSGNFCPHCTPSGHTGSNDTDLKSRDWVYSRTDKQIFGYFNINYHFFYHFSLLSKLKSTETIVLNWNNYHISRKIKIIVHSNERRELKPTLYNQRELFSDENQTCFFFTSICYRSHLE